MHRPRFENYRAICAEIESKQQMLERDKQHVVDAVQTAAEFPYWKHTIPIEGDIYPYNANPIRAVISARKAEKVEIERYVSGIGNYMVRRAIEERYLVPLYSHITWDEVAEKIGYPGTGNALKQYVWQNLKKR